ncbi:MAG: UDP-N-acetylmuramate dehydrogenase [Chlorobiaceae bacterium]|nr:UDP-N-acetylmuramate dehydrogenase [Chlorobiaceae bacterium]
MADPTPPCPFEQHVPLSTVGYYGIGGTARWLARPGSVRELAELIGWCRRNAIPMIVAGKGSNMLFSDDDFPGLVVSTASMKRMVMVSGDELFCETGVENSEVALRLMEEGISGGEWLYRLPGMIGSTVRMNGRCYGLEASAVTAGVATVGLDGTVRWRTNDEVFQGYKQTCLMNGSEVVAGVLLRLPGRKSPAEIMATMDQYGLDREAKHQFDFPSCGSTFKNSYAAGRPSGRIFESLGFKGRREGGAMVSEHHANFIFNTGNARAEEVLRLAAAMRTAAREQAGADLELEVQCAGSFDAALLEACGVPSTPDERHPGRAWAGLLRFPDAEPENFPRTLMQGPLFDYAYEDFGFPAGVRVMVEQLIPVSEARLDPGRPFIRWSTVDESGKAFPLLPDAPSGAFVDQLWKFSVSELFIGGEGVYEEFEVTPEGHWVAIRLDAPRRRSAGHEAPSEDAWRDSVKPFIKGDAFGMELSYSLVKPFIHDGELRMQCCASLGGNRYGLFPWWDSPETPDFHQPARFCPLSVW